MAKRNANLQGAFAMVNGAALRGKHVVLVDDVMTTGATLRAAARELGRAKPASISALVIAVADPRQRHFERA
jgi:predicted amidophosphoribosyltransferase